MAANDLSPEENQERDQEPASPNLGGRPTVCTEENLVKLCAAIRQDGCPESAASYLAGLSPASLTRWKKEDPTVALRLAQARIEFRRNCVAEIRQTRHRDGRPNWRAIAWLLQYRFPEIYGRPGKLPKPRSTPPVDS